MRRSSLLISLFLTLLLAGCGGGNSGGGTDTGDPGDLSNSSSRPGGVIAGKVSLDAQETITLEGASIWIDDDHQQIKKSNSGGDFVVNGLSVGNHELFVTWTSGDLVLMGKSKLIFIGESSGSQKPRFYLGQTIVVDTPSSIQGFIQSTNDATITIKLKNSIFQLEARANAGFELIDIPFGNYDIEFYQDNQLKSTKEVSLKAGEPFDLGVISIE